ncbi:DUF4097 domain-containing protein [Brevibacterium sp. 50QC2O2]|uniref:DUF4097 domain-containing protein n=1 Tax=Brevibacterium sp. 50QC2O2 TaxID=2968459 RepID=UPI00211CDB02|nr:DUF4097 domain-containing protein [Brevibacterium sp. 50QC2O2]MCQ9389326.1 DUF4097 domain-containing protein [Brevibacterium sp. 50QC2O2]
MVKIAIQSGTRTAVRAILIVFAVLTVLAMVVGAGGIGVVMAASSYVSATEDIPADARELTVRGANFNIDVGIVPTGQKPRVELRYLGGSNRKPEVNTSVDGDRALVDLRSDASRRIFGSVLAEARVYIPADRAREMTLNVDAAYGSVNAYADSSVYDSDDFNDEDEGADDEPRSAEDEFIDSVTRADDLARKFGFKGMNLHSESGYVSVSDVAVQVMTAHATTGNIELDGRFTTVDASTKSGNIEVNGAVSKNARVNSTDGNVKVDLGQRIPVVQPTSGVDVQTYSGNVHLYVPTGFKAQSLKPWNIEAKSATGRVKDTLPRTAHADAKTPGVRLRATTNTGDIWVTPNESEYADED